MCISVYTYQQGSKVMFGQLYLAQTAGQKVVCRRNVHNFWLDKIILSTLLLNFKAPCNTGHIEQLFDYQWEVVR